MSQIKKFPSIKNNLQESNIEEDNDPKQNYPPMNTMQHFLSILKHRKRVSQKYINNFQSINLQNNTSNIHLMQAKINIESKQQKQSENQIINYIESICITKMGIRNYDNMQNQDVILEDQITSNCKIYGIFDGHGAYGKIIAQTTKNIFLSRLSFISDLVHKYSQEIKNQNNILTIQNIIRKVIEKTNSYLLHYKAEQAQQSGTTAIIMLITKNKIYTFNIGNSRVVLGKYYSKSNTMNPFQITQDHTIERFDQRMRVLNSGGIIDLYKNDKGETFGPERIWVSKKNYPGTFLTRIIGLSCANNIGIISQPQISIIQYKKYLKYLIIGSDGLWSVMKNVQIIDIIQKFKQESIENIANYILQQALNKWKNKQQLADDISFILIFLQ